MSAGLATARARSAKDVVSFQIRMGLEQSLGRAEGSQVAAVSTADDVSGRMRALAASSWSGSTAGRRQGGLYAAMMKRRVEVQGQQQDGVERATAGYVRYRQEFPVKAVAENGGWLQLRQLDSREKEADLC